MSGNTDFAGLLVEHLHDMIVGIDAGHRITLLNRRAEIVFGRERQQLIGQPLDVLLPEAVRVHHARYVQDFLAESARARTMRGGNPVQVIGAEGTALYFEATIVRTADFDEHTVAVAVLRDVTGQQWVRQSLKQASRIFASAHEGIAVTDADKRILTVNQAFTEITGYTEEEVRGHSPAILQSGYQDAGFYEAMWRHIRDTGQWQGEIWNRRKSGEVYPEWLTISAIPDDHGRPVNYVGVFSDISPIREAETRLDELTRFDPLTSLGNWRWLHDHLEHALERSRSSGLKGALLIGNLNRFAMVNESHGHAAGDRVLQSIAGRLRVGLDESLILARTRGDEFAVLARDLGITETPAALAERITQLLAEPVELADGREIRMTMSIGISVFPTDGVDVQTIMQAADTALHRVGKDGLQGSYCFYDPSQTARARARLDLERQLHRAVEHDELHAWYQPVVGIGDGRIHAAEALVRWLHPQRGLVAPGEFIPVAEETGLIEAIGNRVLASACRDAAAWRAAGFEDFTVAVNLSAHQFRSAELVTRIQQTLDETGLPATHLTLEITETTLMAQATQVAETIEGLHTLGVRLAIDDFGTGYSSLAYLQRFNARTLKVDRSFVRSLPADHDSGRIVAAVLALAQGLEMDVIVEGVETEAQRQYLHRLGATRFQGFLASPAVDAAAFGELLRADGGLLPALGPA